MVHSTTWSGITSSKSSGRPAFLKRYLDAFTDHFPKTAHLKMDPVQFVRPYAEARDREVAGFIASALAYGNVKVILRSVENVLNRLGPRPSETIAVFDPRRDRRLLDGFHHRFNTSRDLAVLLWMIRRALEDYGSLEAVMSSGLSPEDRDTGGMLERFCHVFRGLGYERFYSKQELARRLGVRYFFPSPSQGSACKRLNLFLRWMVRSDDGVDCGVWTRISASQLVIPLDTHIARISRYIGLTDMRSPGWPMAVHITERLRLLDRHDPLRYDFALCHLGIAGDCPRRRDSMKCARCPIQRICRL